MTAIIDYGVGNMFSLVSSLRAVGSEAVITSDASALAGAERIILPGVGAFEDAAKKLRNSGMVPALTEQIRLGKPVLGICLGMQLMFEKSFEYGEHEGLGLIKGAVRPLADYAKGLKIPHMGWNALKFTRQHPLFRYIEEGSCVYFVHSYFAADCEDSVIAAAEYGIDVTAAVASGNVMGCQFHPEKSGAVGLNILRSFCEMRIAS